MDSSAADDPMMSNPMMDDAMINDPMMNNSTMGEQPADNMGMNNSGVPDCRKQFALSDDMRKAWEQHVYWNRMLMVSIAERLDDQDVVSARLMQNPKDIADIFARYYGEDTAKNIEQLLSDHLQIGTDLITALRDGDNDQAQNLEDQWYANADQMAETFASINPYYDQNELRDMLHSHLDLISEMVAARLAREYSADVQAFNRVEQEALSMADYFTAGIMGQFPEKFVEK